MSHPDALLDEAMTLVSDTADQLQRSKLRAAVAESLTGGKFAAQLATGESSADWFCGGVVAYQSEVKFRVLGVDRGPVGTVFIGFAGPTGQIVEEHHIDGDPERVVAAATVAALRMLLAGIRESSGDGVR